MCCDRPVSKSPSASGRRDGQGCGGHSHPDLPSGPLGAPLKVVEFWHEPGGTVVDEALFFQAVPGAGFAPPNPDGN